MCSCTLIWSNLASCDLKVMIMHGLGVRFYYQTWEIWKTHTKQHWMLKLMNGNGKMITKNDQTGKPNLYPISQIPLLLGPIDTLPVFTLDGQNGVSIIRLCADNASSTFMKTTEVKHQVWPGMYVLRRQQVVLSKILSTISVTVTQESWRLYVRFKF